MTVHFEESGDNSSHRLCAVMERDNIWVHGRKAGMTYKGKKRKRGTLKLLNGKDKALSLRKNKKKRAEGGARLVKGALPKT